MQEREKERETKLSSVPADFNSQPVIPLVQGNETDDDPDAIFIKAVAEIDTQPLRKQRKPLVIPFRDVLQVFLCSSLMLCGLGGMIYQAITYPHTLVVLFAKATPASITATLDVPTRPLGPVTLTRSFTAPTTGHGHQDARAASGTVTFYNGQNTPQSIPVGTIFTGQDGVKITTAEPALVPAANLPTIGVVTIVASAIQAGRKGNIAPYDINVALTSVLTVKNQTSFTNGRDARDFQAVAQTDLDRETAQVTQTLLTAFHNAFPLRPGEQAQPTTCHTITTTNHKVGDEAPSVTLTAAKTCSAVAYSQDELTSEAAVAFTHTKPAAPYHLVGSVQTTLQSVTPVSVAIRGKWAYTFSPDYQQLLAEKIQGDSPAKARADLLKTGVIAYASIPATLPPAMYITFLVLVG